jgi:hypothetical protein
MKMINNYVIKEFRKMKRVITVPKLREMYSIEDMILAGTNDMKKFYTDMFKGKFQNEKYYVTENNRLYKNGEIIISDSVPEGVSTEVRHCFTVHSIQGETAYQKLFIDSLRMFDSCMFYTAISRAKCLDQIYIVDASDCVPTYKYEHAKIYKITARRKIYIGSTVQNLEKRFEQHKQDRLRYLEGDKGQKYMTSFEIVGFPSAKITKIEDFKCDSLEELQQREAEIIKLYPECVNKTFKDGK